jgi:hypothetical protein
MGHSYSIAPLLKVLVSLYAIKGCQQHLLVEGHTVSYVLAREVIFSGVIEISFFSTRTYYAVLRHCVEVQYVEGQNVDIKIVGFKMWI